MKINIRVTMCVCFLALVSCSSEDVSLPDTLAGNETLFVYTENKEFENSAKVTAENTNYILDDSGIEILGLLEPDATTDDNFLINTGIYSSVKTYLMFEPAVTILPRKVRIETDGCGNDIGRESKEYSVIPNSDMFIHVNRSILAANYKIRIVAGTVSLDPITNSSTIQTSTQTNQPIIVTLRNNLLVEESITEAHAIRGNSTVIDCIDGLKALCIEYVPKKDYFGIDQIEYSILNSKTDENYVRFISMHVNCPTTLSPLPVTPPPVIQ